MPRYGLVEQICGMVHRFDGDVELESLVVTLEVMMIIIRHCLWP